MPYKNKEQQRTFAREWMRRCRQTYFEGKSCAVCGGTEKLELDHIDRTTKVHHAIWSWSKTRRDIELAKCQVLCKQHHDEKSVKEKSKLLRKLSDEDVQTIRDNIATGITQAAVARKFNVSHMTIISIIKKLTFYSKAT